ncbi:MAG: CDP-alcohol phosphatidyltransferase family protein [Bacteroidales bacterium]
MMTRPIKYVKKSIPSVFTMFNMLSGCAAILLSFHDIALAGIMILVAGVFDFIDGLVARLLNAYSDIGKELDSLADMVSFGVAPSFIIFQLLRMSLITENPFFSIDQLTGTELIILSAAFIPAVFVAIRLARFNLEGAKDDIFSGLPSPAAGIFFASAGYIFYTTDTVWVQNLLLSTNFLIAIIIVLSLLMIVPLPMLAIKFKDYRIAGNVIRYIFIVPSAIAIIIAGISAIPAIIIYYILLSFIAGRLSAL